MIEKALLQTHTARSIVRKSTLRPGSASASGVVGVLPTDLLMEYAKVDIHTPGFAQYGSVVSYGEVSQGFRPSDPEFNRFWDFADITSMRFLVTVTKVAAPGTQMQVRVIQNVGPDPISPATLPETSFAGGNPTVPLDELGVHVSEWKQPEWLDVSRPFDNFRLESYGRPGQVFWWLVNPSGEAGDVGLGVCQVQVKTD